MSCIMITDVCALISNFIIKVISEKPSLFFNIVYIASYDIWVDM